VPWAYQPAADADQVSADRSPAGVLRRLFDGNRRFFTASDTVGTDVAYAIQVAERPNPAALVIGCMDSRVPPEVVFDQRVGDLLVVRTAGHVLDQVAVASVELAVAKLGVPLIVVLGHESCAAVEYAVDAVHRDARPGGPLGYLVDQIAPSVPLDTTLSGTRTYRDAVRGHIASVVAAVRAVPVVADAVGNATLAVAGLRYDVTSGQVALTVEPG
jgi:carbonic anhydrase